MKNEFYATAFTPSVKAEQSRHGSRASYDHATAKRSAGVSQGPRLGPEEIQFIATRDSFYIATVSETGWPYVQHRGGPQGFARVLDHRTIAWADYSGNRQYFTTGNAASNDRAALIFMDYPGQRRLKVIGHIRVEEISALATLPADLADNSGAAVEHAMFVHVVGFDWNCPQHITPRFTAAEIGGEMVELRDRVDALEARLQAAWLALG